MIRGFLRPGGDPQQAIGIVVPHAGYMYSGHVAGAVYAELLIPRRVVILCPNHTGFGPPLSIMRAGQWLTPLGAMSVDEELSDALMTSDPDLTDDVLAHRHEHAIEVQLPFIQYAAASPVRFVAVTIGTGDWDDLEALGTAIAEVLRTAAPDALIIASSDLNHYENDSVTRVKDQKAIDRILALDPRGLFDTVHREAISMCGYGPAAAMLVAANILGAREARLVKYATSAEVSGDFDRVVGYAGVLVGVN
jgi:AmmeMemoRadiSam system protein B